MFYLATDDGLLHAEPANGAWRARPAGLQGQRVTSVAAWAGGLLAGTRNGAFRSEDRGRTWAEAGDGLTLRHVRWLAAHPAEAALAFAGTEPAGLFVLTRGGRRWEDRSEVAALRDANGWYLPYSPEAGCVRGFAFHGDRGYAAVEVGGVLRSDDRGRSWRLLAVPNLDVHDVAVDPRSAERVFAVAQGGLFLSANGGARWTRAYDTPYVRALWIDPAEPDRLLLGPAAGVGRGGRLVLSADGGATWTPSDAGLTTPWPRTMVERFVSAGDTVLAILDDGTLRAADRWALHWRTILAETPRVHAAAAA